MTAPKPLRCKDFSRHDLSAAWPGRRIEIRPASLNRGKMAAS
ncbi:MAG: hypothetical protein U9R57_13615 [Thermodesulfobacteriota bacterium]|nr:hypothetical protein [Thermodesulfobacteriota bacterium]